ncbi:pyruvate kinase [Rhodobacter capsulatus]|uniref:Pyruvate kinase n=1 Tax=Rhodobacter capsulatus TaxID=1061 RepID=A0A0N8VEU5_RHOCA|nr:pyruvate kinase [Rhodobacter capsulatus]KQB13371.1 pyruvate kinase [Rhodobacter capsulatus]KQB13629.1 pyruvate kinase [Rhodobacter capsulatus]PZX24368.1 pyruvate kinase [Rhodobacter capsulatus]QNR63659.1 pyruvate kinase [Rhodobacter capsulatus]WER09808.1 pyruvate kinase [Rhodobacter capsulatus]
MSLDEVEYRERRAQARGLQRALEALRDDLVRRSDATMEGWEGLVRRPEFLPSARNLADYLALRRGDLVPFQAPLASLGLSSLGRAEAHVRPSIDAVLASLAMIGGEGIASYPTVETFAAGPARLAARRDALFGARREAPRSRVMVTLPTEAAVNPDLVGGLIAAGADCVRINCAHDNPDVWAAMIGQVRHAAMKAGRRVPVQMDIEGPKLRVEALSESVEETGRLFEGDRFEVVETLGHDADLPQVRLSHPALMEAMAEGGAIWINDGKLRAKILKVRPGKVLAEVTSTPSKGAKIKVEKGVNLPGVDLRVPALTEADLGHLDFVLGHADILGFSFVQTGTDLRALFAELDARSDGGTARDWPALMLKIETPLALRNLPALIVEAGGRVPVGAMIARGDLAVEIGFERLSEIQEEVLWLCEAAEVPVVWATQVLEGMVKEGQASRAEMTDAAMSQRAECVMLNKGPHLVQAVTFLRDVLMRMDRHTSKKSPRLGALGLWHDL